MMLVTTVYVFVIFVIVSDSKKFSKELPNFPGLYAMGYKYLTRKERESNGSRTKEELRPSAVMQKLLTGYVRTDPPSFSTTEVELGVYIISFYSVNEQTMDYSVSMYLRQKWQDPRLDAFSYMGNKSLRMGDKGWEKIWVPDTFLKNEKGASFHSVTVDNRLIEIRAPTTVWYVIKISATLSCPMTLENFPLDTQVCPMSFESFGYTATVMNFSEFKNQEFLETEKKVEMPQFSLIAASSKDCSSNYTSGIYPCLEIKFYLRRDLGYFIIQVYVPSVLIVILSWVSFWINVDASPARVSIGLLTVLTTTTMSSGARATLPRVSYIKAIDVWMIVCLVFVFTSLIEYAVVNVFARKVARPPKHFNNPPPLTPRLPPHHHIHHSGGCGCGNKGSCIMASRDSGNPIVTKCCIVSVFS
ncbi:hypothetical protein HELRODRAFT_117001 [Helobdella robusta]|uniref:Uncharacterized protein n=1 Tax=Helobdella robusta TaxID=6412 RepID=T1EGJ2_HELRO|nr:hypothetical protein HELRODRAFT_117001 [Helobdella robusta]ESO10352.1 hypothetical protein HELRODRAFT_117001 [Helobdella robusta]